MRGRSQETVSEGLKIYGTDCAKSKIPSYLCKKQVDDEECEELFIKFNGVSDENG